MKRIDRLVAEKVMGWSDRIIDVEDMDIIAIDEPFLTPFEFSPSIKIEDAWKVAEKFDKIKLETFIDGSSVEILNYHDFEGIFTTMSHEYAENTPLAICKAALVASGVDYEKEMEVRNE